MTGGSFERILSWFRIARVRTHNQYATVAAIQTAARKLPDGVAVVTLVGVQYVACRHPLQQFLACLQSATWPPVSMKAIGRHSASVRAWTFVVRPPRERPIACARTSLFRRSLSDGL